MDSIFRILLPILIIGFALHRGYYTNKHKETAETTLKKREEGLLSKFAGFLGLVGFVSMILYAIQPAWLSWASVSLPAWLRWSDLGLALAGFALLQWAQITLGKNWSDTPRMMKEQVLVTSGPYRRVRHPIYTAFMLILGSTFFISANWLIGIS